MVLHPVGPHEPRVYWTRRIVLLLAIALVLVLLVAYGCSGDGTKSGVSGTPRSTPTATPTSTASAGPPTACTRDQLTVAASTDATTYPAGVLPHLVATIRTTGAAPCQLSAGAVSWEIVSGTDTIYTTAGCPPAGRATFLVRPGHPAGLNRVWDRHRSVVGCASPGASAGPGTYQLHVTVAGVRSQVAVFHLTG